MSTDGNGRYVQNGFDEQKGIFIGSALNADAGVRSIARNQYVNSHLIFLNTKGNTLASTTATWEFDGKILGIMLDTGGNLMEASDPLLAYANYFTNTGGLSTFNLAGFESNDSYSGLGTNFLTVISKAREPGDRIRVVTVSEVPVPAALWLFAPALMGFLGYVESLKQRK
ncbi:MAG: hypothetical protein P8J13_01910 [Gammaproteobacteria bacterium]|nr:hypothetical protein [Gammaproteobacteria bacterium]